MSRSRIKLFSGTDSEKLEKDINAWLESDARICIGMFEIENSTLSTTNEGGMKVEYVKHLFIFCYHIHEDADEGGESDDTEDEVKKRTKPPKKTIKVH